MSTNIKLIIATHKKFIEPNLEIYIPLHVGAEGKNIIEGYTRDDLGENISALNPYFCELTGLYWAWKNLDYDYLGLVHYRRYFSSKKIKYTENTLLDELVIGKEDLHNYLKNYDILVPKKRKYYIETLYNHYANTFDRTHLDKTRKIIEELYPEYVESYDKVMKQSSGYMFNMFVMKKEYIDEYCSWLFSVLFELQNKVDVSNLSAFEARLFGRVSELLFNVWLEKNQYIVKEIEYFNAFKVNWVKKGSSFLMAKVFKKKYKKSF